MEAAPQALITTGGPPPGVYRGRGGGRGSFERGRGRGMGRGHFMGGMGRGGLMGLPPPPHGMPGVRGMRPPRGVGYPRGGYVPRGMPPMRGSRPPMYMQPQKQHTGSENNKTISPVPPAPVAATTEAVVPTVAIKEEPSTNGGAVAVSSAETTALTTAGSGIVSSGAPSVPYSRGAPRGRGNNAFSRPRGGYNPQFNGGGMHGGFSEYQPMSRGGPRGRGRGYYGQGMTRPPMQYQPHTANTQIAPVPSLKRGAPGGPPGKRGRYDGGPYSQRPMGPKYHQGPPPQHGMAPQSGYAPPNHHHHAPSGHHGYAAEQQAPADPYASYAAPPAQTSYNGYGQNSYSAPAAPAQNSGYSASGGEYDQTQYQGYSASNYGAQQDTRYQNYGQDYTQQYGAPAVDYNSAPAADYSQHYDERAYAAGYDPQTYQQGYTNSTGYY